jgi:hypothetical protein
MFGHGASTGAGVLIAMRSVDFRKGADSLAALNKEVKRRADVVGFFPNEASIARLVGAILMEQHDEWRLQHRYLSLETITGSADGAAIELPAAQTKAA